MMVEETLMDDTVIKCDENSNGLLITISKWNTEKMQSDIFQFQVDESEISRLITTLQFIHSAML